MALHAPVWWHIQPAPFLRRLPHLQQDSAHSPALLCLPYYQSLDPTVADWVCTALCRAATPVSLSGRPWACHCQAGLILCHISTHFVGEASSEAEPASLRRASLSYISPCSKAVALGTKTTQGARAQHVKGLLQLHWWVEITHNFPWAL